MLWDLGSEQEEQYRGNGAATDGHTYQKEAYQQNPRVEQCLSKLIPLELVVLDDHLIAPQTFHCMDPLVFRQEFRSRRCVREDPEHYNCPCKGDDGQSHE